MFTSVKECYYFQLIQLGTCVKLADAAGGGRTRDSESGQGINADRPRFAAGNICRLRQRMRMRKRIHV